MAVPGTTIRIQPTGWVPDAPVFEALSGASPGASGDSALASAVAGLSGSSTGTSVDGAAVAEEPSALRPNEPAGMTTLLDNDGSVAESGGDAFGSPLFGGWNADPSDFGEVVVVTDATSPGGSGQAIEFRWDADVDEAGVARAADLGGPWQELYFSWSIFWVSGAAWDSEGSPKIFYFGTDAFTTANWIERRTSDAMRVVPQGASAVLDVPGVMPTDIWVRAELHVIAETSGGDGAVYLYIDGDLADSNESVDWNGGPAPWNGMEWYAHINNISTNSVYRVGHFYVSGKN